LLGTLFEHIDQQTVTNNKRNFPEAV